MTIAILAALLKAVGICGFAIAVLAVWECIRSGEPLPFFGDPGHPGDRRPWWK